MGKNSLVPTKTNIMLHSKSCMITTVFLFRVHTRNEHNAVRLARNRIMTNKYYLARKHDIPISKQGR